MDAETIEWLKYMADNLPKYPPLSPYGEITVSEFYPSLSKKELDFVMSIYTGNMVRDPKHLSPYRRPPVASGL